ncbi:MAG: hypothetical protein APR63_07280 [Desulfuromonas sp. SDB]|nr:MAG: hypothetical protein APR63_07280 [Desulfuromonas sp. SDB]
MMEKLISTRTIYKGKILDLYKDKVILPSGRESFREVVRHRGAVAVLPWINREVILVKQYRYAVDKYLWEIPAGLKEIGETPVQTAQRELVEETKYFPRKLEKLVEFYSTPGFSDEIIHIFIATELIEDTSKNADYDEFIEVESFSREKIEKMILQGKIEDAKTLVAINLAIAQNKLN